MSWINGVAGAFGANDCIFAVHPSDEARAKAVIASAKDAGAKFEDLEKEVVFYVYKTVTAAGMQQTHISEQVARAKDLWGAV